MSKEKMIRITSTPPGLAPENIRRQWVGTKMPYIRRDDAHNPEQSWDSGANAGGYIVSGKAAVDALIKRGCVYAAEFWGARGIAPKELRFGADYCEEVEENESKNHLS